MLGKWPLIIIHRSHLPTSEDYKMKNPEEYCASLTFTELFSSKVPHSWRRDLEECDCIKPGNINLWTFVLTVYVSPKVFQAFTITIFFLFFSNHVMFLRME